VLLLWEGSTRQDSCIFRAQPQPGAGKVISSRMLRHCAVLGKHDLEVRDMDLEVVEVVGRHSPTLGTTWNLLVVDLMMAMSTACEP